MILGLTGGIAAGKSTVAGVFRSKGVNVVDADLIAHKVVAKGSVGAKMIKKEFGAAFFTDGRLDRQLLATYCFENKERTDKLNSILHPLIIDEIDRQLNEHKNEKLVILDAPLLIEANLQTKCDKVMVVICAQNIRISRAIKRSNITKMEAMKRIERQLPDSERRKYADYVINNSGALEKTIAKVEKIYRELTE